jgi:hypothetical protein
MVLRRDDRYGAAMPRVPHRRIVLSLVARLARRGRLHQPELGPAAAGGRARPESQATDIAIYAVDPGQDADDDTRTGTALSPLDITTTAEDGQVW